MHCCPETQRADFTFNKAQRYLLSQSVHSSLALHHKADEDQEEDEDQHIQVKVGSASTLSITDHFQENSEWTFESEIHEKARI